MLVILKKDQTMEKLKRFLNKHEPRIKFTLEEEENRIKYLEEFNRDILGAKHQVSNSAENRIKELEEKIHLLARVFS